MLFRMAQRSYLFLFVPVAIVFLYVCSLLLNQSPALPFRSPQSALSSSSRNATLGFGAIYVLTEDDQTWKVQGLRKVADMLGLSLTVPIQPHATEEEIRDYLGGKTTETAQGAVRAIMNYALLLDEIAQSDYETVLIFEEDVDFSVHIKEQMGLVSETMLKEALGPIQHKDDEMAAEEEAQRQEKLDHMRRVSPFVHDTWEVFWPGHFAVEFNPEMTALDFTDPYALPWTELESSWNNLYEVYRGRTGDVKQQVLRNVTPLATFAFALTRKRAGELAAKFREERLEIMDVAVHRDCKGQLHRCVATVPELFHHHKVQGQNSILEVGDDNEVHDLDWWQKRHKYTYNVEWSARCQAAQGGEKIGDRWACRPRRHDTTI